MSHHLNCVQSPVKGLCPFETPWGAGLWWPAGLLLRFGREVHYFSMRAIVHSLTREKHEQIHGCTEFTPSLFGKATDQI